MEHRTLGHSGLKVSALSLGSWNTFEFMPTADALNVLRAATDAGINFLDDARYDDTSGKAPLKTGYSEVVFGKLLKASGLQRERLVISNRMWFEFFPKETFEAEVDGSLSRIGVDYFDLVFCFSPPKELSPEQLVRGLGNLIAAGKIRHWAPGNWPIELVAECCAVAKRVGAPLPPAVMVPYSPAIRSFVENEAMDALCRDYGIAVVASFALEGGILTGKYNAPDVQLSHRYDAAKIEALRTSGLLDRVGSFVALSREIGCSPAQLAYAFCLRHPCVASVLFGATSVAQVEENVGALQVVPDLNDSVTAKLTSIFPGDHAPWG